MKSNPLRCLVTIAALTGLSVVTTLAHADSFDCFPLCEQQAPPPVETSCAHTSAERAASTEESITQIEAANQQLKTAKEWVGYVRSPQGLVIKLFNDHVVKIPAWIGYAIDPLGSLKSKLLGEARNFAKESIKENIRNHSAQSDCDAAGSSVNIASVSSS